MERDERLEIIRGLPKVELHRHLEGSLRLPTILELGKRNRLDLPLGNIPALAEAVSYQEGDPRTLKNLLNKLRFDWYRSYQDLERVTMEAVWDAAQEGIVHLELRFDPEQLVNSTRLDLQGIMEAICESGRSAAAEAGTSLGLIVTFNRERYDFSLWKRLVDLSAEMSEAGVAGVDLAGDGPLRPNQEHQKIFQRAQDTDVLGITINAGEGTTAEQVIMAVEALRSNRIGHGLWPAGNQEVIRRLKDHSVTLELCPISNYQTGWVDDLQRHPLPQLDQAGVSVTINGDYPAVQRSTLNDEYDVALTRWGYTLANLLKLEQNAIRAAFLSDKEKEVLLQGVEHGYGESSEQGLS